MGANKRLKHLKHFALQNFEVFKDKRYIRDIKGADYLTPKQTGIYTLYSTHGLISLRSILPHLNTANITHNAINKGGITNGKTQIVR